METTECIYPGLNFSRKQDNILVDHVAQQPALWQINHDDYRDTEKKHRIWKEISKAVGKPVDTCKKRWKNIKDTYDRRFKLSGGRYTVSKRGARWELFEKLQFLQPSVERAQRPIRQRKQSACNNIYVEEVELDDLLSAENSYVGEPETILEESCESPSSQNSLSYSDKPTPCNTTLTESKLQSNLNGEKSEQLTPKPFPPEGNSGIDLFFQSLAETVKSFPPRLQQRAKMETLTSISALELELWNSIDCG